MQNSFIPGGDCVRIFGYLGGGGKLEGQKKKERFEKIFNIPTDFIKESTVVG